MDIVVCVKQVPEVAEADLEVDEHGTGIRTDELVTGLNEWDNYAVEEAVRIKESLGGTVTVVTVGDEDSEDVVRRALAMGADGAMMVEWDGFEGSDGAGIARGLHRAVAAVPFDMVLTGAQSSDDGWGQVGPMLAEYLGVPCATLAVHLEPAAGGVTVDRELENNTLERVHVPLPALFTIQTGINVPRYVSIMGIRRVRNVEIMRTDAGSLGLAPHEIGRAGSAVDSRRVALPTRGQGAEIITGSLDEVCERAAALIRERGGVA